MSSLLQIEGDYETLKASLMWTRAVRAPKERVGICLRQNEALSAAIEPLTATFTDKKRGIRAQHCGKDVCVLAKNT